jgi:uncharacterized ParB-like nuclease family protein
MPYFSWGLLAVVFLIAVLLVVSLAGGDYTKTFTGRGEVDYANQYTILPTIARFHVPVTRVWAGTKELKATNVPLDQIVGNDRLYYGTEDGRDLSADEIFAEMDADPKAHPGHRARFDVSAAEFKKWPVILLEPRDGDDEQIYHVFDGRHRVAAARRAGRKTIPAKIVNESEIRRLYTDAIVIHP